MRFTLDTLRRLGRFSVLLAVAHATMTTTAAAQTSNNVDLLGTLDPTSGFDYADVWGYTSGNVEVAILTDNDGTFFVDVTDPTSPSVITFIDGANSIWRDAKTYDEYVYIVNEDGGGLQIVSVTDPLAPAYVVEITSEFSTAHNVWIDETEGLLFAVGCDYNGSNLETNVYDLEGDLVPGASPVNPGHVYAFSDFYVHDAYSRDGIAYLAAVNDGFLATVDLTQLPSDMPVLDTIFTEDLVTHNVWTNQSGSYAFATDEQLNGGHITIFDVSDPANIVRVGEYTHPDDPNSVVHNVVVKDNLLYASWYRAGLEVVDVTVPTNPQRVGYYDTSPASGPGFDGAWGVYPFAQAGCIYVSDIQTGLYVVKLDDTFGFAEGVVTDSETSQPIEGVTVEVEGTSFSATTDENGFYHLLLDAGTVTISFDNFFYFPDEVEVTIGGGVSNADITLDPRANGALDGLVTDATTSMPIAGAEVVLEDTPLAGSTDGTGTYGFDPVPEGTYLVIANAFGYATGTAGTTISEAATTTTDLSLTPALVADDMESDQGWTVMAGASTGNWERVDPIGTAAAPEDDHTVDPGTMCWVTGQGSPGGSVGDDDVDGGPTTLLSPVFDLSGSSDATISFYQWFVNDAGANPNDDPFVVDVTTDGGVWTNVQTTFASNGAWEKFSFALSDVGLVPSSQVQVRFVAVDAGVGGSIVEAGIDDFEVFGDAVVAVDPSVTIGATRLMPVSPNPFRADANVRFELVDRAEVSLTVYDVQGRLVRRLVAGTVEAGLQTVAWDGRTLTGASAAPGVYYVRLETPSVTQAQKLVRTR